MPTPSTGQPKRPKILVVDDEPAIRELLKLQLSASGYDVVLADDAFAARRLLYKAAPDVMVVDAHMPYVSGVEFVATLVGETSLPWVPVIFISGREDMLEGASALGSACLVKPFLAARLLELIERVVTPCGDVDAHGTSGTALRDTTKRRAAIAPERALLQNAFRGGGNERGHDR